MRLWLWAEIGWDWGICTLSVPCPFIHFSLIVVSHAPEADCKDLDSGQKLFAGITAMGTPHL